MQKTFLLFLLLTIAIIRPILSQNLTVHPYNISGYYTDEPLLTQKGNIFYIEGKAAYSVVYESKDNTYKGSIHRGEVTNKFDTDSKIASFSRSASNGKHDITLTNKQYEYFYWYNSKKFIEVSKTNKHTDYNKLFCSYTYDKEYVLPAYIRSYDDGLEVSSVQSYRFSGTMTKEMIFILCLFHEEISQIAEKQKNKKANELAEWVKNKEEKEKLLYSTNPPANTPSSFKPTVQKFQLPCGTSVNVEGELVSDVEWIDEEKQNKRQQRFLLTVHGTSAWATQNYTAKLPKNPQSPLYYMYASHVWTLVNSTNGKVTSIVSTMFLPYSLLGIYKDPNIKTYKNKNVYNYSISYNIIETPYKYTRKSDDCLLGEWNYSIAEDGNTTSKIIVDEESVQKTDEMVKTFKILQGK